MESCKDALTPMRIGVKYTKIGSDVFSYVSLYKSFIGALLHVTITHPEISFVVHKLSQFMQCPLKSHWVACKRILRYLHGTSDYGLYFMAQGKLELTGYTNADWASNVDDRTSTGGYCI